MPQSDDIEAIIASIEGNSDFFALVGDYGFIGCLSTHECLKTSNRVGECLGASGHESDPDPLKQWHKCITCGHQWL